LESLLYKPNIQREGFVLPSAADYRIGANKKKVRRFAINFAKYGGFTQIQSISLKTIENLTKVEANTCFVRRNVNSVERGAISVKRGAIPVERGAVPVKRGAVPVKRGAVPVKRGANSVERDASVGTKKRGGVRHA